MNNLTIVTSASSGKVDATAQFFGGWLT